MYLAAFTEVTAEESFKSNFKILLRFQAPGGQPTALGWEGTRECSASPAILLLLLPPEVTQRMPGTRRARISITPCLLFSALQSFFIPEQSFKRLRCETDREKFVKPHSSCQALYRISPHLMCKLTQVTSSVLGLLQFIPHLSSLLRSKHFACLIPALSFSGPGYAPEFCVVDMKVQKFYFHPQSA